MVAVSGQTTTFIYDGDGNLVKKIKPDNSKTIYVGGVYEVDKASGASIQRTVTYYPVAGATLAPHCVWCSAGVSINSTLYYTLKDHLGSASVVTDASGTILGENRYYPFGETRLTTGTIFTDKLFTGQREMAGLGIYHYDSTMSVVTGSSREDMLRMHIPTNTNSFITVLNGLRHLHK